MVDWWGNFAIISARALGSVHAICSRRHQTQTHSLPCSPGTTFPLPGPPQCLSHLMRRPGCW
eukprot:2272360-Rhodomonas_salina.5